MKKALPVGLAVAALVTAGIVALNSGSDYHVTVMLASATNLVEGGTVEENGFKAGEIDTISVKDGKAMVSLDLDSQYAPLHDGATVSITWKALLGERIVQIKDGRSGSAAIPDHGMVVGTQQAPVELDTVLDALNPTTRAKLKSLITGLNEATHGTANQTNLQQTISTAGPALQALGGVLQALGTDGPAIKNLVTRLNSMVTTLSERDQAISTMVSQVNRLTTLTAAQKSNLSTALRELPGTLDAANATLGKVPGTVSQAVPLLNALAPSTAKLPAVARNLAPTLAQLRPVSAKLKPTLQAAAQLLQYTPGLIGSADSTVSQLQSTISFLQPELAFLRPYTPETVGFLSTWASAFGNYDSNGHYARIFAQAGASSFDNNPGILPPGISDTPYPLPGASEDQPWTDAFGSAAH